MTTNHTLFVQQQQYYHLINQQQLVARIHLHFGEKNNLSNSNNNNLYMQTATVMTDKPTHTDVLLGRGVATNRHPGNENFRAIVSRHVVSMMYVHLCHTHYKRLI